MNREEVLAHPLHNELRQVTAAASIALSSETSPEVRSQLQRAKEISSYITGILNGVRTILLARPALDNVANHLNTARNAVVAYANDRRDAYLTTANESLDLALIGAGAFPAASFKVQAESLKKAADDYFQRVTDQDSALVIKFTEATSKVNEGLAIFQTQLEQSSAQLQEIDNQARQKLDEFEVSTADAINTIQDEMQKQVTALSNEVSNQRSALQTTIADYQKQFSAAQEKRLEEANELLRKLEVDYRTKADADLDKSSAMQKDWADQAETFIDDIETKAKTAAERLGIIAAADVAYAYTEEAKDQKSQADRWRWIAMMLFVGLAAAAAVIKILAPPSSDFSASDYLAYGITWLPVLLALSPGIPYAIKQSSEHRRRERSARRRAQELTSFRPFLAELTDADQKQLIKDTAPKYFGGDSLETDVSASDIELDLQGLAKLIRRESNGRTSK